VDYSLICKLGCYTSLRGDSEAQIMREVYRDIQIEPKLLSIIENEFKRKVNSANNATLYISARGLWNSCEKIIFDIKNHTSYLTVY